MFQTMNTHKTKALSDNETFVQLVRLCQDDKESRATLSKILLLPEFQRNSVLGTMTHKMKLEKAPAELVMAIEALRDSEVAEKMMQIMKREEG